MHETRMTIHPGKWGHLSCIAGLVLCAYGLSFFLSEAAGEDDRKDFTPPKNKAGASAWIPLKHQSQDKMLCACASASMVVTHYGGNHNQYEIKELSKGKKYDPKAPFTDFTPTAFVDLMKGLKSIGYDWHHGGFDNNHKGFVKGLEAIEKSLDDGRPVLVDTATGKPSHVITVAGYDKAKKEVYCINTVLAAPGIQPFSYKEFEKVWNSRGFDSDARNAVFTARKGKEAVVPK